jgi:hypothetical protein
MAASARLRFRGYKFLCRQDVPLFLLYVNSFDCANVALRRPREEGDLLAMALRFPEAAQVELGNDAAGRPERLVGANV